MLKIFLLLIFLIPSVSFAGGNFLIEVAKGNVDGNSLVTFSGHNSAVGTTEEQVWPCGGSHSFIAAASVMTLSSGDTTDNQAGVGLRSVFISGLDTNYDPISEVLSAHATDGQLGVNTVNSYFRINQVVGISAGSSGKNAGISYLGTGTITAGVPANIFSCMDVGTNFSENGFYTVANGKTAYTVQAHYAGEAAKILVMRAYQRALGGLFLNVASFNLSNQNAPLLPLTPPDAILAKTDIELRGIINTGTGNLKTIATLLLVDD